MSTERITRAARAFGKANLLIGLLGFLGPAVTGNDDRFVNLDPGHLLGVAAINPPHALLHVLYGVLGIEASESARSSRAYMGLGAVFWGAMAAMGWRATGFDRRIRVVMGFALDAGANVVHTVWVGVGLAFAPWRGALRSLRATND